MDLEGSSIQMTFAFNIFGDILASAGHLRHLRPLFIVFKECHRHQPREVGTERIGQAMRPMIEALTGTHEKRNEDTP